MPHPLTYHMLTSDHTYIYGMLTADHTPHLWYVNKGPHPLTFGMLTRDQKSSRCSLILDGLYLE